MMKQRLARWLDLDIRTPEQKAADWHRVWTPPVTLADRAEAYDAELERLGGELSGELHEWARQVGQLARAWFDPRRP